jgi:hypothetical protein
MLQANKEKMILLDQKKARLSKSLSSITPTDFAFQPLSVITGGGNLIRRVNQMIAEAKLDYAGIVSKTGLARLRSDGGAASLISAKRRGLRVRVITELDHSNSDVANYLARHIEVRQSHDLFYYMDIVDKREMCFGPGFPFEGEEARSLLSRELDLWTSDSRFVLGMYAMFERLWEVSPRYARVSTKHISQC